jgi:zinc transport system substrate-binding protein
MKKLTMIALALFIVVFALAGCGQSAKPVAADNSDQLSIVATIFPPYDFARQVAGDKADLSMLLPPAAESHSFEPTPQDMIKIQNCDVFIYVGGESDAWVNKVLESMDMSKIKVITLMDCVEVVEEEIVAGMEDEEEAEAGEKEPEYDEHVWTSPRNAKLIVQKIADTLCAVDIANAATYKTNTAAYLAKLNELDAAFQNVADNAVRKTIVF